MMKQAMVLAAAFAMTPTWAINKCTGQDGKVTFQDAPCSAGTKAEISTSPAAPASPKPQNVMSIQDVARDLDAQLESAETRRNIELHMQVRKANEQSMARALSRESQSCGGGVFSESPTIGMTESAFLHCTQFSKNWDHRSINETQTAGVIHRQYVYPAHAPVRYLYTRNGIVTAIQR